MVSRRQGVLSLSMIALMLLAVQLPMFANMAPVQTPSRSITLVDCSNSTRNQGDPIHVDVLNGSDAWNGTDVCPKASIYGAVQSAVSNDEIIVHSGVYYENVTIDYLDDLTIRAADNERVVIDGTKSISDDLNQSWSTAIDGIQYVDLPEPGWQLFLERDEQVPARWPNANFSDGTVFNRTHNWAHGTITGSNNAYTNGWLTDSGAVTGAHGGLNASGIDPVGAIAILNVASFRSYSRVVTGWNAMNETFSFDQTDEWKTKHHAYFLEGKRELIDVEGEWWYNSTNQRLHYLPPAGQDANDLDLRVKTQPFAFTVKNSDNVTLEGLEFFGTTVQFDNCDSCTFSNATMLYPSTSKRGLNIAGEDTDDRWVTRFDRCTNSLVNRIAILYTDGTAIEFHGGALQSNNNTINDSYFHHIDWSVSDTPGLMVTIYDGGKDNLFTNNEISLTGASATISIGDAPTVMHNDVWNTGLLQTDGAVVQMMMAEQQDADIAYNWIHDTDKYGIRMDGPVGGTNEGRNATVHHNVLWNVSGAIMVKGDYHNASNNTIFGNDRGKNNIIVLNENGVGNENSTIWHNAADSISAHRTQDWDGYPLQNGTYGYNWNGYRNSTSLSDVSSMLVDPENRDFRPIIYSDLDLLNAGAYEAGTANPWTAGNSWTYVRPPNPVVGCLDSSSVNYDPDAIFSSGDCECVVLLGPHEMTITIDEDLGWGHVAIDLEFSNLTTDELYEYQIWFTRVDPDYTHDIITGNFTALSSGHNLSEMWAPPQEGPYTVHCKLKQSGFVLIYENDTFGWGDVANNSQAPNVIITPTPELSHYDLFGNSSLGDNVSIELDAVGTEAGASYKIRWKLYSGDVVNDGNSLIGITENTQHRNFVMSNLIDYFENNSNFTLFAALLRIDGDSPGQASENELGNETWTFTIGKGPEVTIDPVISGCTDLNATNYDSNATVDDGSCIFKDTDGDGVFDHLEIEGCTDKDAVNFNQTATEDDGTCEFLDTDGDGVYDHLEVEGCTDKDAENYNQTATEDNGSCVFLDTDGDGVYDHLEVEGCTDKDAENYNEDVTEHREENCVYPSLTVNLNSAPTLGDAPLEVSFEAIISGGNAPYEILWNFGDGETSTESQVSHTFEAGVWGVVLQVTDDSDVTLQESLPIVVTGNTASDQLTGYFSALDQMDPISKGMVATFQFDCVGYGGSGSYTYIWDFGDENYGFGPSVLHEYERFGEYTVRCTIEDSDGRSLEIEHSIPVIQTDDEDGGISSTEEEGDDEDSNFDIYATSAGAIGLLLMFGLFGRKRRGGFLEDERRKASGEGSIWDEH
ncbi:MAG: PKD domain-containing protein [Candidatus Thermoplasmatota archaeon]|nr:PKD domain-containing protein [Candidatus Thermoplasmatota archaeon]